MLVSRMITVPAAVLELLHAHYGEYRRACPQCEKGGRDDALAVRVDERGATWYCHRCDYTGSANRSRDQRIVAGQAARSQRPATDIPHRWSPRAEGLWRRTVPLAGTIGHGYLTNRGCVIPPADGDLRFLPAVECYPPCLVAKITDFVTNEPMSLHFTKLKLDGSGKAGTERDKVMLRGHQKKGGVIRLWPDEAVTTSLALAEGIESALSGAHLHQPVWAAVDAGNMADLPVVPGIEVLVIYADNDPAGIKAARRLAGRWLSAERDVSPWMPRCRGYDLNDAARAAA